MHISDMKKWKVETIHRRNFQPFPRIHLHRDCMLGIRIQGQTLQQRKLYDMYGRIPYWDTRIICSWPIASVSAACKIQAYKSRHLHPMMMRQLSSFVLSPNLFSLPFLSSLHHWIWQPLHHWVWHFFSSKISFNACTYFATSIDFSSALFGFFGCLLGGIVAETGKKYMTSMYLHCYFIIENENGVRQVVRISRQNAVRISRHRTFCMCFRHDSTTWDILIFFTDSSSWGNILLISVTYLFKYAHKFSPEMRMLEGNFYYFF